MQFNYCNEFAPGRYSRYYSDYYGDQTITDTNFIENISFDPAQGEKGTLRFEMETSQVCDTDSTHMFKFVTHLVCDETKVGPVKAKTVDPDDATAPRFDTVWYTEPCEYHVRFAHSAGCAQEAQEAQSEQVNFA